MTEQDLNDVIAGFREALRDYVKGDPESAMSFFSDHDNVTLANRWNLLIEGPPRSERRHGGRRRTSKRAVHCTSKRCPAASRKSRGSARRSSAMSYRSSGTRAGSPATTTLSSQRCAPPWSSGVRTACGRSPTATPTRSPLHDRSLRSSGARTLGPGSASQ